MVKRNSARRRQAPRFRRGLGMLAGASLPLAVSQAIANPSGGVVTAGNASIHHDDSLTTIAQTSNRAIINWQDFSIQAGETTRFVQPSSSAATLNRVVSGNLSKIYGTLEANGHVYLVNPNGVVVGRNGTINTQSFVASTLDVGDAEFLEGGDLSFIGDSQATIINLGRIDAAGGDVFLIAHRITQDGTITASGEVGLGAGSEVLLQAQGSDRMAVRVAADDALIDQQGLIEATRVRLQAANNNPYALAINQQGLVRATGASTENGRIVLSADAGRTEVAGTLEAAGGDIDVLGDAVHLRAGARIDASADGDGGDIRIGGGLQGQGTDKVATDVQVDNNVIIDASSHVLGDGGSVIVWADEHASVGGEIFARGGAQGGDGGFVETSGKDTIDFSVTVDASAPHGEGGTWLIDPTSITIDRTMADSIERALDRDTNILVTTYTGWPADENDTVTDQVDSDLIASTPDTADKGNITLEASITKRIGDQQYEFVRTMKHRGDVPVGAHVEELDVGADPVILLRSEINATGDLNVVEKTIVERSEAQSLIDGTTFTDQYVIEELDANPEFQYDVVYEVTRQVADGATGAPTLEFISPDGSIFINAPIVSLNGALDVVINAGARADFTNRVEGVHINDDIITNGGTLAVRGAQSINVADGVMLSTRDLFGVDANAVRFVESSTLDRSAFLLGRPEFVAAHPGYVIENIADGALSAGWHDSAASQGWSGDIMLMTDKNIGYSNFYLFYRSDISGISIGENARLFAHADSGRDGSVRLLSVANLTDAFEDMGWLGVRNFVQSSIDIADGTVIKGGVVDVIADARADADVGSLIAIAAAEVVESTSDTGVVGSITLNEDETSMSVAEQLAALIMDTGANGNSIEEFFAANPTATAEDLAGAEYPINIPMAKIQKKAGGAAEDVFGDIPFVGEFLALSPVAIALAEADAAVRVGNNVRIEGTDLVTVRANAEASANGASTAPGLAVAVANADSRSDVQIGQGSVITSSAKNRAPASDPLFDNIPFIEFTADSPWGQGRGYLSQRQTTDAVEIRSSTLASSIVSVEAASLTEEISSDYLQKAEEDRARSAGEGTQSDKTVNIDSPVDVAFGYIGVTNNANLHIAEGAEVVATEGSVDVVTVADTSVKGKVVGGKVAKPKVTDEGTAGDGSDGSITEPPDANDVVNVSVAVQYVDVDVSSRVDGRVAGQEVSIGAASLVGKNINSSVSDNGYADDTSGQDAVKKKIKDSKEFPNKQTDKLKTWIGEIGDKVFGDANKQTKQKIPIEDTDPKELQIGLAGAVAVAVNNFNVTNTIGEGAVIESIDPQAGDEAAIRIWSHHTSGIIHNSAKAGVHAGRKNATAAGVAVGIFNNTVSTVVEDGALIRVDHQGASPQQQIDPADITEETPLESLLDLTAIEISADSTIESPFSVSKYQKKQHKPKDLLKAAKDPKAFADKNTDPKTVAQSHLTNLISNGELLTTSWAQGYFVPDEAPSQPGSQPTTQQLNADSDKSGTVGVAGSFNLLNIGNRASTEVGNATIEVIGGSDDGRNDVNIVSRAWAHTVMAAGTIAPPTFKGNDQAFFDPDDFIPGDSAGTGVGGAINLLVADTDARTEIFDGAIIRSDNGDAIIDALNHYESTLVQVAGGKADEVGVSGTFALANLNVHSRALVADGADIDVDDLVVRSWNTMPGNVLLSGGFAFSGAVGIGASVSIANVNRSSEAILGVEGEGGQAAGGGQVNADNVEVDASSTGFVTAVAVAGGVQAPDGGFVGDSNTTASNSAGSGAQAQDSSGGVGISGSVGINLVTSRTTALMDIDGGEIRDTVNVTALDATDITSVSGGAALTVEGGVAVTGAASINRVENHTTARVRNLNNIFNGYEMNVTGNSIGRIQGFAIGIAATTEIAGTSDGPDVAAAGSFTYNDIRANTIAELVDSIIWVRERPGSALPQDEDDEDAIEVLATDGSQIIAMAGALAIDASSGGDAVIGAGVGINTLQGRVQALIDNSEIRESDGRAAGVAAAANRIAPIYSFGVAGGVGTSKMAAAASVGINTIDTLDGMGTFAEIRDTVIDGIERVTVQAGNESQIFSLAGAIAATSGSTALGGALSWSEIGGDVSARVTDSDVEVDGDVRVLASTASASASTDPAIDPQQLLEDSKQLAKAAKAIYTRGAAGLVSLRDEENPPAVQPVDTIDLFGGEAAIYTLAIAGGGSSNVAAFGSGTVNIINSGIHSGIHGGNIVTGGNTVLLAENNASIRSAAGSLAISGGAAAVGGAASYNTLRGTTYAGVVDASVQSLGDVVVAAERGGLIETLSAGAAIASTAGVQGSASISTFADRIDSEIAGSLVEGDEVSVLAREDVESTTAAGGVAGGGTAAVGASVAVLVSENEAQARIGDSLANNARVDSRNVQVRAESEELHNTTVMTASGSGTVGVAGSVGIKVLNNQTRALVDDNSLINQNRIGALSVDAVSRLATTGAAGAVGVGIGATGVGAGLDLTVMNAQTSALIGDNVSVDATNVAVTADSARDIASFTVAGGVGFVGAGGAVSVVHVGGGEMDSHGRQVLGKESYEDAEGNTRTDGDIEGYVNGLIDPTLADGTTISTQSSAPAEGDTLAMIGASDVRASNRLAVDAIAQHDVDVSSGALAGGIVGAGAGVSSVSYASHTSAITRDANLFAANELVVKAQDLDRSTHRAIWQLVDDGVDPGTNLSFVDGDWFAVNSLAGSGGLVGIGAAISVVDRDNNTLAEIRGGSTDGTGSILVDAVRERHTRTLALGAQTGAATAGASVADVTENGTVRAVAGGEIGQADDIDGIDEMIVRSHADNRNVTKAVASSVGIVTGNGVVAAVNGESVNSEALIADGAIVNLTGRTPQFAGDDSNGGNLTLDASAIQRNDVYALSTSVAAGVAVGATEARLTTRALTHSGIGAGTQMNVRGFVEQYSVLQSAEQLPDFTLHSLNRVRAEAMSGALLAGVSSTVAVSEQDQLARVSIGDGSDIDAAVALDQKADVIGYGQAVATGGAVAGAGSVGVITAENRDDTRSLIEIGNNVTIDAQAMTAFQRALGFSSSTTRGIAGAIASANVVQNTRNLNERVSARYLIGDGTGIKLSNRFGIEQIGTYVASASALGTSGGLSAVNTVNAIVDVDDLASEVKIGAANIRAGLVDIKTQASQNLVTSFTAEAYGGNGVADVTVNTSVNGRSGVDLASGARLEASSVDMLVETLQVRYAVTGLAKVGAATGSTVTSITNNLDSDAEIVLADGAEIASHNLALTTDDNDAERDSRIEAKIENSSASFFLGAEDVTDNQNHRTRMQLDGDLVGISSFGRSVHIRSFGQYTLLNGAYAPWLREEDEQGRIVLADIAPEGSASVRLDVGDGSIDGSGQLLNQAHFFTDVTIEGSSRLGDVRLVGEPQDLDVTLVRGGGSFADTVVVTEAPDGGTINLLGDGDMTLTGIIDAGAGSINVINNFDSTGLGVAPSLRSDGGSLWANQVSLQMGAGAIGGDSALAVHLRDTAALDAGFTAQGGKGINVDLTLHGADNGTRIEQAVIGDIGSNGEIRLQLLEGQRADGGAATAVYRVDGNIESRGRIALDVDDSAELVLDGHIASGPGAGLTGVYVNISDTGEIDTNWEDLFYSVTEFETDTGDIRRTVNLGDVSNNGGSGVEINAVNLSGSGSVFGNGSALDVTITNAWQVLDTLTLGNISLGGDSVGVTINGNDAVASNDIDGIQIERVTGAGGNRIDLIDPHTGQLVFYGTVEAGEIHVDMENSWLAQTLIGDDSAVLRADTLSMRLNGGTPESNAANIGWLANPLRVDVGSGGLSLDVSGDISLAAQGDLHINQLETDLYDAMLDRPTLVTLSAAGNITSATDATITGGILDLSADGNLDLGNTTVVALDRITLSGDDVRLRADAGISDGLNLFGLTARGDAEIIETSGIGMTITGADVEGATLLQTDGDIVAVGDFAGALSISGIDGPDGNNWGVVQIVDSNDLVLGNIGHGFNLQEDPAQSYLRLTAGGDIVQQAGSTLSLYGRTLINAGGDLLLDQGNNLFDFITTADAPVLTAGGDIAVHAATALTLGRTQAGGNFAVQVANGDLDQVARLDVGGDTSLDVAGSIHLGMKQDGEGSLINYGNRFAGRIHATSAGILELAENGHLELGLVDVGSLSLFASGDIIGHERIQTNGVNRFFTQQGSVIFDHVANELGVIGGVAGQDVTLVSTGAMQVSPFDLDGKLTLRAQFVDFIEKPAFGIDWIGDSIALTNHVGSLHVEATNIGTGELVTASPMQDSLRRFRVDGEVTLIGGIIDFDSAEFGGPVTISATGPVRIINHNHDLVLGNVQASDLFLSSSGSILGSGVIGAAGTSYLAATNDVVLDNAQNDFGRIYLFNTSGNNNVVVRDRNDLAMNAGSALASLDVEVGGEFSLAPSTPVPSWVAETGSTGVFLDVSGDARVLAGSLGDFQVGMRVDGDLWLGGHNDLVYNFQDSKVLVGGVLDLYAGNNLTVESPLDEITYPDNSTVPLSSAGAIVVNSITAGGDADVAGLGIFLNEVNVGGDLSLSTYFTSNLGAAERQINITGPAYVGGDTYIESTGDVTISHADNRFVGQVNVFDVTSLQDKRTPPGNIVSGNDPYVGLWLPSGDFYYRLPEIDVTLVAADTLSLGDVMLDGALNASADALHINGSLSAGKATHLTASAGSITGIGQLALNGGSLVASGDVLLANDANQFGGISVQGRDIRLHSAGTLELNALITAGDVSLTADDFAISGGLDVPGNLSLTSRTGDLSGLGSIGVDGDMTLQAAGSALISASRLGGLLHADVDSLSLTLSGADLQLGTISTTGSANFNVIGAAIDLESAQLDIGTDLTLRSLASDLSLDYRGGAISHGGVLNAQAQNIRIVSDDDLLLGDVRADDLSGPNETWLDIRAASIVGTEFIYGDNVTMTSTSGDIDDVAVSAIGSVVLSAAGDLKAGVFNADTLSAAGQSVDISYNTHLTELVALEADNNITLSHNGGDVDNAHIRYDGVINIDGDLVVSVAGTDSGSVYGRVSLTNAANTVGGLLSVRADYLDYAEQGTVSLGNFRVDEQANIRSWNGDIRNDGSAETSFGGGALVASGGDIQLSNVDQRFAMDGMSLDAGDIVVTTRDARGLRLEDVRARGDLVLDIPQGSFYGGGGGVVAEGAVVVDGHTRVHASASGDIVFENEGNRFAGGLSLVGGTASIVSSETLRIDELVLRTIGVVGQGAPSDPVPGRARLQVMQGDILLDGPVDSGGLTFVMGADQGDIIARHADNRIVDTLPPVDSGYGAPEPDPASPEPVLIDIAVVGTAGNIEIVDSTDLAAGRVVADGNVSLVSAGDLVMVDQPEGIPGAGDGQLATLVAGQALALRAAGDVITGAGQVSAGNGGISVRAGNDIVLGGAMTSGADIVLAAGGNFHNDSAFVDPLQAAGRWLVYSTRPDQNTGDMVMGKDFFDYGIAFNPADPQPSWLPGGNGLLYEVLPVIDGITLAPLDQTIVYGNDIDRSISAATIGSLGGTATGRLLVDGVEVDAGVFGITVPSVELSINPEDLLLDLNESVITRSGGGYINVGDYSNAIVVSLVDDSGSSISLGIGGSADLSVLAREITLDQVSAADKVYDGSVDATLVLGSNGLLAGDIVSIGGVGVFNDRHVGTDKLITISNLDLLGADAGNYVLADTGASTRASITPRQLAISLADQSRAYNGTTLAELDAGDYIINGFVVGEGASLDKDGQFNSANVLDANQVLVNIGEGDFVDLLGDTDLGNYQFADTVTGNGAIRRADLVLTANDVQRTYAGESFSGGNGISASGFVNGETLGVLNGELEYGGSSQGASNAGVYTLSASGLSSDNYRISWREGELTITPAVLQVSVSDVSRVYDGSAFAGGSTVHYSGFVGDEDASVLDGALVFGGSAQGAINVGSYDLAASGLSSGNYDISYVAGSLDITPAQLLVTVHDAGKVYDGLAYSGGNGVSYSGFVAGEDSSVLGGALVFGGNAQGAINAGSYDISAAGLLADNYDIQYQDGTLTVDRRVLDLTLLAQTRAYDGTTAVALDAGDFVFSGLVAGEQVILNAIGHYNSRNVSDAESVNVVLQDGDFSGSNGFNIANYQYSGALVNDDSGIVAADLLLTTGNTSVEYSGQALTPDSTLVTASGLAAGETLADLDGELVFAGSAVGARDAGSYLLSAEGLSSDNYNISWQSGTLTITPRDVVASIDDISRVYDSTAFSGGTVSFDGFVAGEDSSVFDGELVWGGDAQGAVNAGSYSISASGVSARNYNIIWQDGTLEITPAELLVSVNDARHVYDGSVFSGGNGVTFSGFQGADRFESLGGSLQWGGDAQGARNAGDYTLSASGLVSGNYNITYQDGTLTIDRRALTVSVGSQTRVYDGTTQQLVSGSDIRLGGFAAGESASVTDVIGSWNSRNVAEADTVTVALTGADLVNASGGFDADNYILPAAAGNDISYMSPAQLTVTANDVRKLNDGTPFSGGNGVSFDGLVGGDSAADIDGTLSYAGTSQGASAPGNYSIQPGGLTSGNYVLNYVDGQLTIFEIGPRVLNAAAQNYAASLQGILDNMDAVRQRFQQGASGSILSGGKEKRRDEDDELLSSWSSFDDDQLL